MTDVVLDVDTGVDDALAILFAVRHPQLRVRGISCVAGNTHVDQVVANTLTVLDQAGAPADLPVARGARRPLLEPVRDASFVHGADGLGDLGLPASARRPDDRHAVRFLWETLSASTEPVTLIALAPLTNLALLLRTYPGVTEHIERLVVMGGSASVGNATPVAEFNVWHDPEAAAIVFDAGIPTLMYGLDVFHQVTVPPADCEKLAAAEEPGARLAGALLRHQMRLTAENIHVPPGGMIGDAGAVCAVADPGGLGTESWPVQVELAPGLSRGQTLVDRRTVPGELEVHHGAPTAPSIDVALTVDAHRLQRLFVDTITG